MKARTKQATQRFAFTKRGLASLPLPASGRATYRDEKCPGLIMVISHGGSRCFYLYRRIDRRPARLKLGEFPAVSVEQARTLVKIAVGDIAAGINPVAKRRAGREEPRLNDLWAHWKSYAEPRKKSWPEDERNWANHLKRWTNRRLSAVQHADVQALHAKLGKDHGPYAANRVLALLSSMFNRSSHIGWNGQNPCKQVERFPEVKRDRFLQHEELPAFFSSLAAESSDTIRDFFAVAIFTGVRRRNVQEMAWDDVSFGGRIWKIDDNKSGVPVVVSLDDAVLEILRRRQSGRGKCRWVFPSAMNKTGHITEPKHAWDRICERAGLADLRMHDLRRTLGSWQAMGGTSLVVIAKSLGHRSLASTEVYARLTLDPVRQSVASAVTAIRTAGGLLKPPAKAV